MSMSTTPLIKDSEVWGRPWDDIDKYLLVKDSLIEHCTKISTCPHCEHENGTIEQDPNAIGFFIHNNQSLYPLGVLSMFEKMIGKDCELLHIAKKPENLIIKSISVPPLAVRPSFPSKEDDLTERLKKIIKANEYLLKLTEEEDIDPSKLQNRYKRLQFEVAQFINSDDQQGQPPLAGLVQRLRGRQGRIRGTLSGKNVNYTARTVISPCPYLKITEAEIPSTMADHLTYPERVTPKNIENLKQCVRNGANSYPGAKLVRKLGVSMLWESRPPSRSLADELRVGDIVDRKLMDGDIVLLNKQPSLHRMSMMCHRARIRKGETLRLNASVCNAYNADFNGDEMIIHVPQTEEARTEAVLLMAVSSDLLSKDCIGCIRNPKPNEGCSEQDGNLEKDFISKHKNKYKKQPISQYSDVKKSQPVFQVENNLCTPKNGEILVSPTQDFLICSFLLTRKETFYDRSMASLILSYMGDDIVLPNPAIIKPVTLWSGKQLFSILFQPHKNVSLTVKEKTYSTKRDDWNRELKTMCPDDGFVYFRNSELISGQLGNKTLGIGNKEGLFYALLNDCKSGAYASCINRLSKLSAGWIGNHGFSIAIHDVKPQNKLINMKRDMIWNGYQRCEALMQNFSDNELHENAGHLAAQNLETKITDELNDICNTLGEVCMETLHERNSLLTMSQCGSNGSSINISQMVACVGQQLVGGSRAANGFTDRSLPHFPKQAKNPAAKGFVANSFYCGLSATELLFHAMGVRGGLALINPDTRDVTRRLMKALEDLFSHYDCTVRNTSGDIVQFCYGDDGMDPASVEGKNGQTLNLERLFLSSKALCPKDGDDAAFGSSEVSEVVNEKLSELCLSNSVERAFSEYLKNFSQTISGSTRRQLEDFVDTCVSRYPSKVVEAGTPIGAIGALSIEEPVAKMTPKTFRFAGEESMNVTCGVNRIIEIIFGYRKIRTPIITTILERDDNENIAKEVKHCIEATTPVQGIETVKRVVIHKDPNVDRFMLLLEGTGLRKVMRLAGVNARETVSNHVLEMFDVLGIEAARNCIIDQIKLTMSNQGMRIDLRHIMLLADEMTVSGKVLGMTDDGFRKRGKSVLTLASIDKAPEHLFDAGAQGRGDPVEGVTDCIIMGRPIQIGTGMVKILKK